MRVGIKENFMTKSQAHELESTQDIITIDFKTGEGAKTIDIILEPTKLDELGTVCRLNLEEYIEAVNEFIDSEKESWNSLRMKDQINGVRDKILEKTILKYAKEKHGLDLENYNGTDVNYIKRYDKDGKYLGEAIIITLTSIPEMQMQVRY